MRLVLILLFSLISLVAKSSEKVTEQPRDIECKNAPFCPIVTKICTVDGFDFPLGKPNAAGYYKSRGWLKRHPGEDWVAFDRRHILGAPVYAIGAGIVVFTRNAPGGWGNVVIIRHAYYGQGLSRKEIESLAQKDPLVFPKLLKLPNFGYKKAKLYCIDSFYAHLHRVFVQEGQLVVKGQPIGQVGTNRGLYPPHLHFEIRKNLSIGINRAGYARNFTHYWPPTTFIETHRRLQGSIRTVQVPIATFVHHSIFPLPIDESRVPWRKGKGRYKKKPLKKKGPILKSSTASAAKR